MNEPEPPIDGDPTGGDPPEKPEATHPAEFASDAAPDVSSPPASAAPGLAVPEPAAPVPAAAAPGSVPADMPKPAVSTPPSAPAASRRDRTNAWSEGPETVIELPETRLASQSRRDFLIFAAGVAAAAGAAWWLLPDRTRARLLPGAARDRLDSLAARVGLSREARERTLDRALTFDDDIAEALYSKDRRVRTYRRDQVTPLRSNYAGRAPGPEFLPSWELTVGGLGAGGEQRLPLARLLREFALQGQVTRLVCVEGWSAIAWWGGIRFADLLDRYPPAAGLRWAALRSEVSVDGAGRPDPYYVSIDLDTARHPQTLLATHFNGRPLPLGHGAPLRLLVPMKLGLKNIKAVTHITYTATEPPDYWNERGYSKYDGI